MDVCGFDWANEIEEDYTLQDFFPKTIPLHLQHVPSLVGYILQNTPLF